MSIVELIAEEFGFSPDMGLEERVQHMLHRVLRNQSEDRSILEEIRQTMGNLQVAVQDLKDAVTTEYSSLGDKADALAQRVNDLIAAGNTDAIVAELEGFAADVKASGDSLGAKLDAIDPAAAPAVEEQPAEEAAAEAASAEPTGDGAAQSDPPADPEA